MLEKFYFVRAFFARVWLPVLALAYIAFWFGVYAAVGVDFWCYLLLIAAGIFAIAPDKVVKGVAGFFKSSVAFVVGTFRKVASSVKEKFVEIVEGAKADAAFSLAIKDLTKKTEHRTLVALTLENDKNDVTELEAALVEAKNKVAKTEERLVQADEAVFASARAAVLAIEARHARSK